MKRADLAEIKDMLRDRIGDLCLALLPDGRREGRLWVSPNPVTMDHGQVPAFKVALNRDTGAWIDWRSGEKGDVIGLVAYVQTGNTGNVGDALSWASDWLGISRLSRDQRDELARQIKVRRSAAEEAAKKAASDRLAGVDRLWRKGDALGSGTAAEARGLDYFAFRGMPLVKVPNLDKMTFRFVASLEWWEGRVYRYDGKKRILVRRGPEFPAIISAMRVPTGQVTAVHCTFLDPAGRGKAPVPEAKKAKLMFGDALGAVIRISHGPEGLPPEQSSQPHPLMIGEGVETMGSAAIAISEARAWAGGSLSGIRNAKVGWPFVSSVHPCAENDWANPQALAQYDRAIEELEAQGKPVSPMRPHFGSDFNDLM
ncbi:DUF7146 domain-containing protein [Pleomorphomonas koreensis]|uniref:DUF7146 domain-containing protein n=1 Tax=Pleomorphomonas koreensis TaxID=257440 RepID=UPI000427D920|nr:toprim domain-containing protein [Pleomorphomonas koreensis]